MSLLGTTRGRTVSALSKFSGPVRVTIEDRPGDDDEQNTDQTLTRMVEYAERDAENPIVSYAAAEAVTEPGDPRKEAESIHGWIRQHVTFVDDSELAQGITATPEDAEVLIRPVDLLAMREPAGDCDDFSMLAAAMLGARGINSRYRAIAADPNDTQTYSHVYVVADLPDGPLPLDCSHGPYPGWQAFPAGKVREWPLMIRHRTLGDYDESGQWVDSSSGAASTTATISFPQGTDSGLSVWGDSNANGPIDSQLPSSTSTTPTSATTPINISALLTTGINDAAKILGVRYSVPQLNAGETIATTKAGTVITQLQTGATSALTSGLNMGTVLLIGAGVLFAFLIANGRK